MPARYEVRPFESRDIDAAALLISARHRTNRATFPLLPERFERPEACAELILGMMSYSDGFAAEAEGELAGFMFAIKNIPNPASGSARFGPLRGSMMFAHGHSVADGQPPYAVYNALFAALAERYLTDGIFEHFAHVPAGQADVDDAWSSLGFGRSAAVAARTTAPLDMSAEGAPVRQATPDDLEAVYRIAASGNAFHAHPPIFVPYVEPDTEEDVLTSMRAALADENQALFLGMAQRQPVALLWMGPPRGSPMFTPDDACYIGDTAVLPDARGEGIGTAALSAALSWARDHGYRHATLHFATANPISSAFWTGHGFQPVMYHLRRLLDERIAWARPPELRTKR